MTGSIELIIDITPFETVDSLSMGRDSSADNATSRGADVRILSSRSVPKSLKSAKACSWSTPVTRTTGDLSDGGRPGSRVLAIEEEIERHGWPALLSADHCRAQKCLRPSYAGVTSPCYRSSTPTSCCAANTDRWPYSTAYRPNRDFLRSVEAKEIE